MASTREEIRERLPTALPDDPPVGVHLLTEFMFCPRVGIIAWETLPDDAGNDIGPPPRLDYLPRYDLRLMNEELNRRLNRFWMLAGLFLCAVATVAFAVYFRSGWGLLAGAVGTFAAGYFAGKEFRAAFHLVLLLRQAKNRRPAEPAFRIDEPEWINWWELLAAGFVSKRYDDEEPLRDPELRLAGKPWRVLARGSHRIPVFLQRRPTDRLYPQHFARIAAYCHLVELSTGFHAPYGIILEAGSYFGWAVPKSAHAAKELGVGLELARKTILALRREHKIPAAPPSGLCANCPLGRPRRYRKGKLAGWLFAKIGERNPFLLQARGRNFHSECGDRYRWVPPHQDVAKLEGFA